MRYAIIPPDTLFSAWAFFWVIFYYLYKTFFGPLDNPYANPVAAIFLALSFQFVALVDILCRSIPSKIPRILLKLLILTIVFKLGPFLLVYQYKPVPWKESTISCAFALLIYLVYLFARGLEPISVYLDLLNSLVKDDDRAPPYYIANQIMRWVV